VHESIAAVKLQLHTIDKVATVDRKKLIQNRMRPRFHQILSVCMGSREPQMTLLHWRKKSERRELSLEVMTGEFFSASSDEHTRAGVASQSTPGVVNHDTDIRA
jgi:hypothetical protein